MQKPTIMSKSEFKSKTNAGPFARRTNPLIKDIDHLLGLYRDPRLSPSQHVKILATIHIWCLEYIRGGGTRLDGVNTLLDQVRKALDSDYTELTMNARHTGFRWGSKIKGTEGHTPQGPVKALEGAYKAETVLPGKGSVAGYKLEHRAKRYNVPAYRDYGIDLLMGSKGMDEHKKALELIGKDAEFAATYTDKAAEMLVAALPMSEQLDMLSQAMAFDAKSEVKHRREHFEYCTEQERAQYIVHIIDGRFYSDPGKREPFDTGKGQAIYAVDEYGRFYVKLEVAIGNGSFNHSSFMRGKPIKCAGNVVIKMGKLEMIDNGSGHYRPGATNLKEVLRFLHYEKRVNLLNVEARRCDLPKHNGEYPSFQAWKFEHDL